MLLNGVSDGYLYTIVTNFFHGFLCFILYNFCLLSSLTIADNSFTVRDIAKPKSAFVCGFVWVLFGGECRDESLEQSVHH